MKVALVHDGLFCRGGGEKVLLLFMEAFPGAEIFTSIYNSEDTYPEFKKFKIHTSWFSKIAKNERQYKYRYFPLAIIAMRQLKMEKYDLVLMATTHCSKYVRFSKESAVIAYTFTPFRLAWMPESYSLYTDSGLIIKTILKPIIAVLKRIDRYYSQKIPHFIAMTEETRARLIEAYKPQNDLPVLNPPIDVSKYFVSKQLGDYYLVVSRLEKYKRIDIVIDAFNMLKKSLVIVGTGVEKHFLQSKAGKSITFKEAVSEEELASLYSQAKALVFPQYEDYGLTPLESAASGRPVIAYGHGGVKDTMIPYNGDNEKTSTAIFFHEQNPQSLIRSIELFETINFDSTFIRAHAEKYHKDEFLKNIKRIVDDRMKTKI